MRRFILLSVVCVLAGCAPLVQERGPDPDSPQFETGGITLHNPGTPAAPEPVIDPQVVAVADELFVPFLVEPRDGPQSLKVLTKDGMRTFASFEEPASGASVLANMIAPERRIVLARVGEKGYMVFDTDGQRVEDDYGFVEDSPFWPTETYYPIDDDTYAYGIHGEYEQYTAQQGGETIRAGVYIRGISDGSERFFPMARLGMQGLEGLKPFCLSRDGSSLYLHYVGWEGFRYASVWKLRLADFAIDPIFEPDDTIIDFHCSDRRDLILGIRTGHAEGGMGGLPSPPSSLVLFSGADGSSKTLVELTDTLIDNAAITPDGQHIVYTVLTAAAQPDPAYGEPFYEPGATKEIFMLSIDGTGNRSVAQGVALRGMSHDGRILIVSEPAKGPYADSVLYSLLDTATGNRTPLTADGYSGIVSCDYGQGYDCFYNLP